MKTLILMLIIVVFSFGVHADDNLDTFNDDPTAQNFESLSPEQKLQHFDTLSSSEQQKFFVQKTAFSPEEAQLADSYLSNKGTLSGDDITIANNYFSSELGVSSSSIDLSSGAVSYNGVELSNGDQVLDLANLKQNGLTSMVSTADGFVLNFANADSASSILIGNVAGSTDSQLTTFTQNPSGGMTVQTSTNTLSFSSGDISLIKQADGTYYASNVGSNPVSVSIDKKISYPINLGMGMITEEVTGITLDQGGSISVSNTEVFSGVLEKGSIAVKQTRVLNGEEYSIEQTYSSVDTLAFGYDKNLNDIRDSYPDKSAYVSINPAANWKDEITSQGVLGAGAAILGSGVSYSVTETSNGDALTNYVYDAPLDTSLQGDPAFIYGGNPAYSSDTPKIFYSPPYVFQDSDGNVVSPENTEEFFFANTFRDEYTATLRSNIPESSEMKFESSNSQDFTSLKKSRATLHSQTPSITIIEPHDVRKAALGDNLFAIDTTTDAGNIKGEIYITKRESIGGGGLLGEFVDREILDELMIPTEIAARDISFTSGEDVISCANCKGTFEGNAIVFESDSLMEYKVGNQDFIAPEGARIRLTAKEDVDNYIFTSDIDIPQGKGLISVPNSPYDDTIVNAEITDAVISHVATIPKDETESIGLKHLQGNYKLGSGKLIVNDGSMTAMVTGVEGQLDDSQLRLTSISDGSVVAKKVYGDGDLSVDLSQFSSVNALDLESKTLLVDTQTPVPVSILGSDANIYFLEDMDFSGPASVALYGEDLNGVGSIIWSGTDDSPLVTFDGLKVSTDFATKNAPYMIQRVGVGVLGAVQSVFNVDGTVRKSFSFQLAGG